MLFDIQVSICIDIIFQLDKQIRVKVDLRFRDEFTHMFGVGHAAAHQLVSVVLVGVVGLVVVRR